MSITWLIVSITRLGQISSKIWHIICQSLAILFSEYFLKYILAVMADKSDEEIQIVACWKTCRLSRLILIVSITRLDQISSKIWHIVCQSLAILFCEYFLNTSWQLWLIKATRRFKFWRGFTSTSDSDNRRCESIIWPNGMFWLYTHSFK
jgi:hypothetical protein